MSAAGRVVIEMSMSLDGFVATTDHSTEHVHAWYEGGDVAVQMPNSDLTFHVDEASAIAQAKAVAGDKPVGVAGGDIAMQCLRLGLLDELWIHLTPVLLGAGIRLFDELDGSPVQLEQQRVVVGRGVTHLFYAVVDDLPR
jgi:riboflavin biosynthesis pyrimidine reductase